MSGNPNDEHYACLDDVNPFEFSSYRDEHEDDIEPWWERFYDERDDYEGYRDEVER